MRAGEKRNHVDYDMANAASETEAEELIAKATEFQQLVEDWIRKAHPKYDVDFCIGMYPKTN